MKIDTIFKNIVYRALCIFQLSGSIFWMLYSTETSIRHEFCIYGVKPRSTGPFTVPKNIVRFSSILTPACMPYMSGIEVEQGVLVHPAPK